MLTFRNKNQINIEYLQYVCYLCIVYFDVLIENLFLIDTETKKSVTSIDRYT